MGAVVDGSRTRASLATLKGGFHQAVALTIRAAVEAAEASAKGTTRFQDRRPDGGTRSTIRGEAHGLRGFIEAAGAAHFLEWGTVPHLIVAHGKALRFTVAGQVLFRKWVHHPGTASRPFMREARERGEQAFEYGIEFYLGAAIAAA